MNYKKESNDREGIFSTFEPFTVRSALPSIFSAHDLLPTKALLQFTNQLLFSEKSSDLLEKNNILESAVVPTMDFRYLLLLN